MPYSKDQITNINQRALAVPRKKYVLDNGEVYIGQTNGRVIKRDAEVSSLSNKIKSISSEPIASTSTATSLGNKYKIGGQGQKIIKKDYDYYIHANFEIKSNIFFAVNLEGQLSLGDGSIKNNGTLINNGLIIGTIA